MGNNRILFISFFLIISGNCLLWASTKSPSCNGTKLQGTAEDLWGNKLKLATYAKGITIIYPFSPANCGYCLVDGEFVKRNYFDNNKQSGGFNFLQCLFNPQLDIYTYVKHYRETLAPVLTFPPMLHDYHQNGFPMLISFLDGKLIYRGYLNPYEEVFQSLSRRFWPKIDIQLTPTSPLHLATSFIRENKSPSHIEIHSKEDLCRLTNEDCKKNLFIEGKTEEFDFKLFKDKDIPVNISSENIKIGDQEFPKSDVGLVACFPNPFNRERYIILKLWGGNLRSRIYENWVDYTIYRDGVDSKPEILLHGFFDKNSKNWRFSQTSAYGICASKISCKPGVCFVPPKLPEKHKTNKHNISISSWGTTSNGKTITFGTSNCRFPSMTVDKNGICWVVWEEDGDIFLSSVNYPNSQITMAVEDNSTDSFNPIVVSNGSLLWIFYLNNKDGFYQLYGKFFEGNQLSNDILISERGPFDVITPAVACNRGGKIVLAWSEWKANERYLQYRSITNRNLGEVKDAAIKKSSIDYINAWYPSLIMDDNDQIWGAWNQHYPATLCVCAGNLTKEASSVTRLIGEDSRDNENGGYPSIIVDNRGRKWVFWESFGWDIRDDIPQKILGSYYDEENGQWSLPYTISLAEQTALNQTPKAVIDEHGAIWVVWSGRKNDISKTWGIYMAYFSNNKWSFPKLISEESINSRAPSICTREDGKIWIAWHSGVGKDMQIKVLEYSPAMSGKATFQMILPMSEMLFDVAGAIEQTHSQALGIAGKYSKMVKIQ